jgi:hypothetical protein
MSLLNGPVTQARAGPGPSGLAQCQSQACRPGPEPVGAADLTLGARALLPVRPLRMGPTALRTAGAQEWQRGACTLKLKAEPGRGPLAAGPGDSPGPIWVILSHRGAGCRYGGTGPEPRVVRQACGDYSLCQCLRCPAGSA